FVPARRDGCRLSADREGERTAGRSRAQAPRRAERVAADDDADLPPVRHGRVRHRHGRGGVLVAGSRPADLRGATWSGPSGPAGGVRDPGRFGDRDESAGRSAVPGRRPAGACVVSAPVWQRRRAAAVQVWQEFRGNTGGLVGAAFIVALVVASLVAPLVVDQAGLDVVTAPGSPLVPPSGRFWLGTDESVRSSLPLTFWGARVSLLVGFAATRLPVLVGTPVGVAWAHSAAGCRRC